MGLIPDAVINLVLMIAFAGYVAMGLIFFITGIVYMGDAGAVGATGIYLMAIGFIMMVVGGIALWANSKQIWLVLFVIECFNVALFLFLYIVIVIALMMAMGVTDPVRKATTEGWDEIIPTLTLPGSNPDGDGAAASGTYCQMQSAGTHCTTYYEGTDSAPFSTAAPCTFGTGFTQMEVLNNCSKLEDLPTTASSSDTTHCPSYKPSCVLCRASCMEAQIDDVKELLLPMSVFVLGLMCYLFIAVVFNNIMIADDDLSDNPIKSMIGYIVNGGLLGLSLIMVAIGGMGAAKAADACPGGSDCTPTSTIFIILIGLSLMVLSGIMLFGIKSNNNLLMSVAVLVMVFMAIALVLCAIVLGMSTGVVMDDMDYYYDTQYPKLRSALEKADNSFCRMSKDECTTMVTSTAAYNSVATKVTVGKFADDGTKTDIDPVFEVTFADVWKAMHAVASSEANKASAPAWLSPCKTTPICIYCNDIKQNTETVGVYVWDMSAANAANIGLPCTLADNTATPTQCVVRAPNFAWADGLVGRSCANCIGEAWHGTESWSTATNAGTNLPAWTTAAIDYTIGNTATSTAVSFQRCMGAEILTGAYPAAGTSADDNSNCIAPFEGDDTAAKLFNVRCNGDVDSAAAKLTLAAAADGVNNPCDSDANTLIITSSDEWTDLVDNYTRWNEPAKASMPYCEEAITDYVAQEDNCKTFSNQQPLEQNSYYSNCDQCNMPLTPFLFNAPGPIVEFRQCLNFFTGHMHDHCSGSYGDSSSQCLTAMQADAANIKTLVDGAFDPGTSFCGYSDDGCKAKIKYTIENSMSTIGIMGGIFLFFFLAVIYCTLEAIKHYMGGDDDDGDDDDDDE